MPQYLYRLTPTRLDMLRGGPTAAEADAVARHFAYLQGQLATGTLLMAGRTLTDDERTFGIAVLQVDSEATARGVMDDDPAAREGVMRAEMFPYRVALWSPQGPAEEVR